jgi:hypothetical protein
MPLRDALQSELTDAMRQRDRATASAVRSALAALDNAGAVPGGPGTAEPGDEPAQSEHVAGGTAGLAATEVPRRELTATEAAAIVVDERAALLHHAERLARLCRRDEADAALRGATALSRALAVQRAHG